MGLLERDEHLAVLLDRFRELDAGGRLVLVSGEAGAGKTSLIEEFRRRHLQEARVLVGRCDDLFAARPLGPFVDIAREHRGALSSALAEGDSAAAFEAFLTDLSRPPHPVVVVLEDLQWADEATLDLLRLLARRLDVLPCLIVATHRDDLANDHPLRRAWGSLVGSAISRIELPPLSRSAVAALAKGTGIDARSLYARTGGNPFFVAEVIAGEQDQVPTTVRDTILARATRLGGSARDALDAAAMIGCRCSPELVIDVADCDLDAIDECIQAGFLVDDGHVIEFRHDLTREAIASSLTPLRRRLLHRRALDQLGDDGDIARRAHHAIGAGDRDAIVDLGTRAADRCTALGAHRQAELLYRAVIQHADGLPPAERLRVLQQHTRMCLHVEDIPGGISSGEQALALLEAGDDVVALAEWESEMSSAYYNAARAHDATIFADRAVSRLEPFGRSPALARALGRLAGRRLVTGHFDGAIDAARRAIEMGERVGEQSIIGYAMNALGAALTMTGNVGDGIVSLREAVDRCKGDGQVNEYLVASANLGSTLTVAGELLEAVEVITNATQVAEEQELLFRRNCLLVTRIEPYWLLGWWDQLLADAEDVLGQPTVSEHHRMFALAGRGRVQVRRGDPGAAATLAEAFEIATRGDEVQVEFPVRLARVELLWLAGDTGAARDEAAAILSLIDQVDVTGHRDFLTWCRRLGMEWRSEYDAPPIPMILADDARGVAQWWERVGSEHMAADALADSTDEADLREACERLTAVGSTPRALEVARRLRRRGARGVRRGPRATTRANRAGLTPREVEVAALLCEGLTNAQIATRLVISPKTVDHHVSSVLAKLGVGDRRTVASAAAAIGLAID
ncbi:MAG TPA: AAA family ATPase [Acidimicrobiales bacterium]|nr:AAA family ATPase [Acidimicrobiales bacterium]